MGFDKQYTHLKPYKQVRCIDNKGVKMIYQVVYGVIRETESKYHIQFDSRGTKWYKKTRFVDIPKVKVNETKKETRHSSGI